jgi:hypothetical protein
MQVSLSTVDLLALTSINQLIFTFENIILPLMLNKLATLFRRSTVLIFPLQFVYPDKFDSSADLFFNFKFLLT